MARNTRRSRGMKKLQPAVLQMQFTLPAGESFVDLSLAASIMNRRGYKQENMNWAVSQFELLTTGPASQNGLVSIFKLPETWVYDNAYQKSRALWHEMNEQVLDDEPSIQGKYHDFKIYMDSDMSNQTIQDRLNPTGTILTPIDETGLLTNGDFAGAVSPRADWEYSQLTIPNDAAPGVTVDYYLHGVGGSTLTSKGIVEGYARSRARPQSADPNVPTTEGWMTDLFDDGNQLEELRDIIVNDNDRPPYPVSPEQTANEFYPGGDQEFTGLQIHSFCNFTSTTVSQKNTIMGGVFQNGLMKFFNQTEAEVTLIIHLVPGTHRGYLCEAMD